MRLVGVDAETALLVGFVVLIIALEPLDMAVAFEGEHVGGDAVSRVQTRPREEHLSLRETKNVVDFG